MKIFQIFSQELLSSGLSFNSNFLEANVLNILLLLSGLIYVLREFLGSILIDRQSKVLFAISESEERLKQAKIRLSEAEKQLAQTQLIINQIINEAEITAKKVRESILEQGKFDIEKLTKSSKDSVKFAENQVRLQIQQQITVLAIQKVSVELKSQMNSIMQEKIIDQGIMHLEGNISL
uniref:ATP synthase subunit b, chloroplastic n=1 Tax=Symphyocladiella dendroidea TaxID=2506487 RepID=A0A1Z1M7Y5_9FLOR|nr:ATP synthase CF0 subunit I [Symphyocladiella dendroidea]ARW61864.1 ATP synthase CF0 subunit I [Symphyocladiella dendroidea]